MSDLYARAVLFVKDGAAARRFYVEKLGFTQEWGNEDEDGVVWVCQVSLFGFELILNQAWGDDTGKIGHGRVFIGLEDDQIAPMLTHIAKLGIPTERREWGKPTLVVRDLDGNELFFWDWPEKQTATP